MRSASVNKRGWFGLITKGSGMITGIVELVDVQGPLTKQEMLASVDRHCIPEEMIVSGEVDKWCYAWVLQNMRKLSQPVPYSHPSGAVIWVNLEPEVCTILSSMAESDSFVGETSAYFAHLTAPEAPLELPSDDDVVFLAEQVPQAKDGSCFGPHLARGGSFTVGAKGDEQKFGCYDEALAYLKNMTTARWRRPNASGNWGIVAAVDWVNPIETDAGRYSF